MALVAFTSSIGHKGEIMSKLFAVIENNKVANIVVGVEDEVITSNPGKYIEYTNGWDFENGIDGGDFFIKPIIEETPPA